MNTAVVSVVALFAAVVISFWKKVNLGVICIGFAFLVGRFITGMRAADIYVKGFPLRLFFLLLATTLFSAIAKSNGTYAVLGRPIAIISQGRRRLLCLIFFLVSFVLSGLGLGTIVTPALLMPFLLVMAKEEEIPEFLTMLLCISGCIAGGLSSVAPTGLLGAQLAKGVGVENYTPVHIAAAVTFCFHGLVAFFAFGGTTLSRRSPKPAEPMVLNGKQFGTVTVLFCIITAVLGYKIDIGLSTFAGVCVLLLFGAADQNKVIAGVSWSTLLLLCGASVMFYVISASGGITLVEQHMAGSGFETSLLAGMMSFFASSSAVVMPTLIPRVPDIGPTSPMYLVGAIIIGAHAVAYSPVSTMGAVAMTLSSSKTDSQKLFVKLFSVAVCMWMITGFFFLLGFYDNILSFME
ncbi:MAG: hypothetical protein LBD04_08580 [Synergistaceae bacterium]|nr:hypothetical protein [Synergistaceae bacterium]